MMKKITPYVALILTLIIFSVGCAPHAIPQGERRYYETPPSPPEPAPAPSPAPAPPPPPPGPSLDK